jgi:hypothetical protein
MTKEEMQDDITGTFFGYHERTVGGGVFLLHGKYGAARPYSIAGQYPKDFPGGVSKNKPLCTGTGELDSKGVLL